MDNDLLYRIALTLVPQIGDIHARSLFRNYGSAKAVFDAPQKHLEKIDGIGIVRARSIKRFNDFKSAEKELRFIKKYQIQSFTFGDAGFPRRLAHCYDAPFIIFYKGNSDLNASRTISVIGTRSHTDYGRFQCELLISELKDIQPTIISGLAYGIDTLAHKAALKNNLPTIAVLAHGLDRIYPLANKGLAREIIENGGLITDFRSGTQPDKQNFPARNRITAGISDAVVVIESGIKGGSLITADIAQSYNRDIFAFPGRAGDIKSEGCNDMIKSSKAQLITCAGDLMECMMWQHQQSASRQRELFSDLNEDEMKIMKFLEQNPEALIDRLSLELAIRHSKMAETLLSLEIKGLIQTLPGKRYRCC